MYAAQMHTFNQTKNDIARMQEKAWMPLLISTDEEGGFVQRIMNIFGDRPGALQTFQTGNIQNAAKLANGIAHDALIDLEWKQAFGTDRRLDLFVGHNLSGAAELATLCDFVRIKHGNRLATLTTNGNFLSFPAALFIRKIAQGRDQIVLFYFAILARWSFER